MEKGIPEASRAILRQWQVMGLKFTWDGQGDFDLGFDGYSSEYVILKQPIPEGLTVEQVRGMREQGLRLRWGTGLFGQEVEVGDDFNWMGTCKGVALLARLNIPAQPIPEKLLREPVAELPKEECSLSDMIWNSPQPTRLRATVESDPNGLNPHTPGAKLDAGKNRLGLVLGGFARALEQVGRAGTGGAVTYSDNGWKEVDDALARYEDAMLRHWVEIKKGNAQDLKTGLLHQAHLVWNALAVLELMLKEPK